MDDDDGDMESTFAQQLKEEFVSTKIGQWIDVIAIEVISIPISNNSKLSNYFIITSGIMEDLEDMRMEAMENKRKAMMKKKSRK